MLSESRRLAFQLLTRTQLECRLGVAPGPEGVIGNSCTMLVGKFVRCMVLEIDSTWFPGVCNAGTRTWWFKLEAASQWRATKTRIST